MKIIETLISGLNVGVIYAMIALGYTMVYGIAKLLNFAHGDIIMVGGYVLCVFCAMSGSPWVFLAAIVASVVICVLLGVTVEKVAYKPLRGASPLAVLITAIGVSYLLQSIAQICFGSAPKYVAVPNLGTVSIGALTLKVSTLVTLITSVVVMVILSVFVKYTRIGRAMIAVSEEPGRGKADGNQCQQYHYCYICDRFLACGACRALLSVAVPLSNQHLRRDARYQGIHCGGNRRNRFHSGRNAGVACIGSCGEYL